MINKESYGLNHKRQKAFNKVVKVIDEFLDIHDRQDKLIYLRDLKHYIERELIIILPIGLNEQQKEEFNFKEYYDEVSK